MMSFAIHAVGGDRPGEIFEWGILNPADIGLNVPPEGSGRALVTGDVVNPSGNYVNDWGVQERPVMPIQIDKIAIVANGADTAKLTKIPADAKVTVNGSDYMPDTATVALNSTVPGIFQILVSLWPYQDFSITIEAT